MSTDSVQTDTPVVVNQTINNADTDATEGLIEALPYVVAETKKGYRTSEFWITIVGSLLVVLDGIPLPEKYEGAVAGLIGAAYIISRGIAKKGVPHVEQLPDTPAPSA